MYDKKSLDSADSYSERVKDILKEIVSDELYDKWEDTFEIEAVEKNKAIVSYYGTDDIKEFKKEYRDSLSSAVYLLTGDRKKIKISKKSSHSTLSPSTKKNIKALNFFIIGMCFVCIATAVIIVMCNYIGNRNFKETFYNTSSIKLDGKIRVIQLSDLHGTSYGKENEKLLKRIGALKPDVIICTGDIVNSKEDVPYATALAKGLSEIAPSYYVYGNNEVELVYDFTLTEKELDEKFGFDGSNRDESAILEIEDSFEDELEKAGIKVLKNEKDTIKVNGMNVDIYGVLNSNPSSFWSYSGNAFFDYMNENKDNLKITAVHEPFIFEEFPNEKWGDLMVAGHTHGGVVRIPVLGPMYTNEGGILPERNGSYVYGRYAVSGGSLIVSAGLENKNVLRINNEPELVVIDINKF